MLIAQYAVTLLNTILNMVFQAITIMVLPRYLSLSDFGIFQFSTSFFNSLRSLFGIAAHNGAFYYSAKMRSAHLYFRWYLRFFLVQTGVVLVFTPAVFLLGIQHIVFNSDAAAIIFASSVMELLTFFFSFLLSYGDARGNTIRFQAVNVTTQILRFAGVLLLLFIDNLTVLSFIGVYICGTVAGMLLLWTYLKKDFRRKVPAKAVTHAGMRILRYSFPLATLELVSVVYNIADKFIVQFYLGADGSALYLFALKFIVLITVIITPAFNIFWRYVVKTFDRDRDATYRMFMGLSRFVMLCALLYGFFLFQFSERIVLLVADERFAFAAVLMQIMVFATLPLAVEKPVTVIYYATDNTRIFRNVTMTLALLSLFSSGVIAAVQHAMQFDQETLLRIVSWRYFAFSVVTLSVNTVVMAKLFQKPIATVISSLWGVFLAVPFLIPGLFIRDERWQFAYAVVISSVIAGWYLVRLRNEVRGSRASS